MKKYLLLAVTALTPLTLFAQSTATGAGGGLAAPPAIAPVTTPAAPRLPEVQFDGETLKAVVQSLHDQARAAKLDPNTDPLNIVISPGLEELTVPALSLRNVSPTEVLSVATTVLGLRMEPVQGDDGVRVVAWLIKRQEAGVDPFAAPPGTSTPPPTNSPYPGPDGLPGGTFRPGNLPPSANGAATATGGNGFTVPAPVAIAESSPGGAATPAPAPAVRVFGIAPLLTVTAGGAADRENERAEKFARLIDTLNRLSNDQSIKTDIAAYREMDILVVKCADRAGMELIAEAIEAMKSNVGQTKTHELLPRATGGR